MFFPYHFYFQLWISWIHLLLDIALSCWNIIGRDNNVIHVNPGQVVGTDQSQTRSQFNYKLKEIDSTKWWWSFLLIWHQLWRTIRSWQIKSYLEHMKLHCRSSSSRRTSTYNVFGIFGSSSPGYSPIFPRWTWWHKSPTRYSFIYIDSGHYVSSGFRNQWETKWLIPLVSKG